MTFLLPSCPVAAKNVKGAGLNAKVAGTSGATGTTPASGGGTVAVGKTGVQLRWHAPDKFTELTKEQRKELSIWNRATQVREVVRNVPVKKRLVGARDRRWRQRRPMQL